MDIDDVILHAIKIVGVGAVIKFCGHETGNAVECVISKEGRILARKTGSPGKAISDASFAVLKDCGI